MKKNAALFAALQVLITAVVLLLVSSPLLFPEPGTRNPPIPATPSTCEGQAEVWGPGYGYGSNESSPNPPIPVLVMQPDATGYVCVTYQHNGKSDSANASQLIGIWQVGYSKCTGNVCAGNIPSHSFMIDRAALNSTLPFVGNATANYVSFIYSLTALGNSTGFYDSSAPLGYCAGMPLAVGHSASLLSASDFPPLLMGDCVMKQYVPLEVGIIGMQVAYLEFPNQ